MQEYVDLHSERLDAATRKAQNQCFTQLRACESFVSSDLAGASKGWLWLPRITWPPSVLQARPRGQQANVVLRHILVRLRWPDNARLVLLLCLPGQSS